MGAQEGNNKYKKVEETLSIEEKFNKLTNKAMEEIKAKELDIKNIAYKTLKEYISNRIDNVMEKPM